MRVLKIIILLLVSCFIFTETIHGDGICDFTWKSGNGVDSIDGNVKALGTYGSTLIAGCDAVACVLSGHVLSQWDGSSWQQLFGGPGCIHAITVYNSELIVGGNQDCSASAGGACAGEGFQRWNGIEWQCLGYAEDIFALTVFDDYLVAGGRDLLLADRFSTIAQWDGSSWQAMGAGINFEPHAFAVYDGKLVAGGVFYYPYPGEYNTLASWDGEVWQPLGQVTDNMGEIYALTVYNGDMVAGGTNGIARWNGECWHPMGEGLVYALTVYNGELIAGGLFGVVRWDGNTWQQIGGGINGIVHALTVFNGELIVGGDFMMAGSNAALNIARWGLDTHLVGDLNHDCYVDYLDLILFCDHWLDANCMSTGYCGEADHNYSFNVDLDDFALFAASWLNSTIPAD